MKIDDKVYSDDSASRSPGNPGCAWGLGKTAVPEVNRSLHMKHIKDGALGMDE